MGLTLSLSALASWLTKSLSAILTASGSTSTTAGCTSPPRIGDIARRTRAGLAVRSGEPVRGIGLPWPSVVVANVFSNPVNNLTQKFGPLSYQAYCNW